VLRVQTGALAVPFLGNLCYHHAMSAPRRNWLLSALCASLLLGCQAAATPPPGTRKPAREVNPDRVSKKRPAPEKRVKPREPREPRKSPPACRALADKKYLRKWTEASANHRLSGPRRVALARKNKLAVVKKLFADAKLQWPPRRVLLRAFKREKVLEVWASAARTGPLTRVANYAICSTSGRAGPKLREGDGQVPEGFYFLDFYHSRSTFFLAMRVNYPNRRDRKLKRTGSAIMIHGNCVSIGCLAMSDERIQELWLITTAARRRGKVAVHIFPTCDLARAIKAAKDPSLAAFWTNLKQGMDLFDKDRKPRKWTVGPKGEYLFP